MHINRRGMLKKGAMVGIIASGAGCTGGGDGGSGGGDGGDGSSGGGTTTQDSGDGIPDPADVGEQEYAEEWRKVAKQKAAEELQGENLSYFTTSRSQYYRDGINQMPSGFVEPSTYEPLSGKIVMVTGSTGPQQQKYVREYNAGGTQSMDVIGFDVLEFADQVEFMDLTTVPGFRQDPVGTTYGGFFASQQLQATGLSYNPDQTDNPPTDYEDLLSGRFADGKILLDFTPSAHFIGAQVATMGWEYFERLADQNPTQISSGWGISKRTGQGDAQVCFQGWLPHVFRAQRQGLTLEYVDNADVWWWGGKPFAVAARPKHPWASKLFADWHLRPDNHKIQAVRPGTISKDGSVGNPAGEVENLFNGKVWGLQEILDSIDGVEVTSDIIKKYQQVLGSPVG